MQETCIWSLGWEDPLEKGKATHSSILVWRIPRNVQSTGSLRVGQNQATVTLTFRLRCGCIHVWASLVAQMVKNLPALQETWVQSLGQEDPLEKEMAAHSSALAWRIPWTEESGAPQSVGSQRAGHDWAASTTAAAIRVHMHVHVCNIHERHA